MSAKILSLIDKQDNFEIIRDKIAAVLVVERDYQKKIAPDTGKDPLDYDFDVYVERSTPWELLEDSDGEITGQTPLVNVYFDSWVPDLSRSDMIKRQEGTGIFIIDCLAAKNAKEKIDGFIRGDKLAAIETQRVLKLVRNILMSGQYVYLELQGVVGARMTTNIQMFQPQINDRAAEHVVGARIRLEVDYNEFAPEVAATELQYVAIVTKNEDGKIMSNVDFDYTET